MKRTCKQCGKEFFLSQSELNFYRSKKLAFPKRCKECRANNKGDGPKANAEQNVTNKMKNSGNTQKDANRRNADNVQSNSKIQRGNTHNPQNNRHQYNNKTKNDRSITYLPTYGQNVEHKSKKGIIIAVLAFIALVIIAGALLLINAHNSATDLPVMENPLVDETLDVTMEDSVTGANASDEILSTVLDAEVVVEAPDNSIDEPADLIEESNIVSEDISIDTTALSDSIAEQTEEQNAVEEQNTIEVVDESVDPATRKYTFASKKLLDEHYQKHGIEMGFASAEDYEKAASDVVNNPNALTKKEAEDNDDVYYVEATNEFVVVSTRGFIRTYFKPNNGKKYYDKQ